MPHSGLADVETLGDLLRSVRTYCEMGEGRIDGGSGSGRPNNENLRAGEFFVQNQAGRESRLFSRAVTWLAGRCRAGPKFRDRSLEGLSEYTAQHGARRKASQLSCEL